MEKDAIEQILLSAMDSIDEAYNRMISLEDYKNAKVMAESKFHIKNVIYFSYDRKQLLDHQKRQRERLFKEREIISED